MCVCAPAHSSWRPKPRPLSWTSTFDLYTLILSTHRSTFANLNPFFSAELVIPSSVSLSCPRTTRSNVPNRSRLTSPPQVSPVTTRPRSSSPRQLLVRVAPAAPEARPGRPSQTSPRFWLEVVEPAHTCPQSVARKTWISSSATKPWLLPMGPDMASTTPSDTVRLRTGMRWNGSGRTRSSSTCALSPRTTTSCSPNR